MVEAVVAFALKKLDELLIQKAALLWGLGDKIRQLKDELMRIKSYLKDAEAKKGESQSILHWITEIRHIAYDAEDILESFVLQVASKRGGGGVNFGKSCLDWTVCICHKADASYDLGSKMDNFNARLSDIRQSFITSGIKEALQAARSSSQDRQHNPYETFSHVVYTDLVGLENNVAELITNLLDIKYGAVSIWGMGGVGKTTLAKQIYNHAQVQGHFSHFAWASISQQCQTYSQLKIILKQLSAQIPSDVQNLEDSEVSVKVNTFIKDNTCLVVLDDIWNIADLENLKIAIPNESGSKILLTSRIKDVASQMKVKLHGRSVTHELHPLQEEESWELFQTIVFWIENVAESEEFKKLGRNMVKHCKGLPLAIRELGSLLARTEILAEWQTLDRDIQSCPEGEGTNNVNKFLSLSYDHLSTELKQCFLYMGMFPKNYEIPLQKLFQYWVAEGLVSSTTGNTAEDRCKTHLRMLMERSMVLKGTTDMEIGLEMETCRMHDRMRNLCLFKAKEENFLQVNDLHLQRENRNDGVSRRLAEHFLEDEELMVMDNINPGLRSLVYLIPSSIKSQKLRWSLPDLLFLRVLDLDNVIFAGGKLHKAIGKLVHLRYLSLKGTNLETLPSSFGNLTLLLTLDLRVNYLGVIPKLIGKMENLMHLYLPRFGIDSSSKIDFGNLRKLETLENFEIGVMNVKDLLKMVNLRRLTLFFFGIDSRIKKEYIIFNDTLKIVLKNLRDLEVRYEGESGLVDGLVTKMVSACTNLYKLRVQGNGLIQKEVIFSAKITSMKFSCCSFEEEDPMSIFEKLPNLRYLKMSNVSFPGGQMVCSKERFPQLRSLSLVKLDKLEGWVVEEGAMSNLLHLEIDCCPNLKILPDGLPLIRTLEELKIWNMPKEFEDRVKEGGQDCRKFQYIPFILILQDE